MAALIYAALDFAVYPASAFSPAQAAALGTFPKGEGGWHLATTDNETVRGWSGVFADPAVNIGVATGSVSRLIVIDIDEPPATPDTSGTVTFGATVRGHAAADGVRKWAAEHGLTLPGNAVVATPSGGQHLWLRIPAAWVGVDVPRRLRWLPHVDLLWDKHMIKAPPSVKAATARKPGGEYRFTRGCPCEVPEADDALIRAMYETPSTGVMPGSDRNGVDPGDGSGLSDRLDVDGFVAEGIPVGQQNEKLHAMACSFAAQSKPPSEALAALAATVAKSPVGDPSWPWSLDDLQSLVERAYAFIARDRGTWINLASKIRW